MPTKKNFLGGQQNYNKETGEYESSLVGPGGNVVKDADGDGKEHEGKKKTTHTWKSGKQSEIEYYEKAPEGYKELEGALTAPNGYRWYSNGKSYFDKDRDTVLVKDQEQKVNVPSYIEDADKVALVPDLVDKGYTSEEAHNILFEARDELDKQGKEVNYNSLKEYIDGKYGEQDFNEPGELESKREEQDFDVEHDEDYERSWGHQEDEEKVYDDIEILKQKADKNGLDFERSVLNDIKADPEKYSKFELDGVRYEKEGNGWHIYEGKAHSFGTANSVANKIAQRKEEYKPNEFKLDRKKYPDVETTKYGFVYNVDGVSIVDEKEENKAFGGTDGKHGFRVLKDGYFQSFDTFEDAYNSVKGKEETKYPKGTSKEYTEEVNKKYSGAVDTLKKAGIKTDFKNYEEISKAQDEIMSKWEESKDDAKYKPLYEALEIVEDKIYNDDYIRLAPYGY